MVATQQLRYAESFNGLAFPLKGYEYQPEQGFRVTDKPVIGGDYSWDHMAFAPWTKQPGIEPVRFLVAGGTPAALDTIVDGLVAQCINSGLGTLQTTDAAGNKRWCYAKVDERPGSLKSTEMWGYTAMTLHFRRYSNWKDLNPTAGTVVVSVNNQIIPIINAGNAPVEDILFRFRSSGVSGFNRPLLTNLTNGYAIGSLRTAADANSEVRIETGRYYIAWSTNDGVTLVPDYTQVQIGTQQVAFFRLEANTTNQVRYSHLSGIPSLSLEYSFFAEYH